MHLTNEPSEATYVGSGPRANAAKRRAQVAYPENTFRRERGYVRAQDGCYLVLTIAEQKSIRSAGGNMARGR